MNLKISLLMVLPVLILFTALPSRRIIERQVNQSKVVALEQSWRGLTYDAIQRSAQFEIRLSAAVAANGLAGARLTPQQSSGLLTAIQSALLAFSTNDYNQYRSFRFPLPPDRRSRVNPDKKRVLFDFNAAYYPATVEYEPSPQTLIDKYNEVTTAYFTCVLQTDQAVTNHSVYLHWYWQPETKTWLPYEFRAAFTGASLAYVF